MPEQLREYKTRDYTKISPWLGGEKKSIKVIENTRWHTTIVYWIPPSGRDDLRKCDKCKEPAEFLYYDLDHEKRYFIQLFCRKDAYPDFVRWLNEGE